MDRWKFYDIGHRDHTVMNPTSLAKVDEILALLDLPDGAQVLDVACGKGEMLLRLAERVRIGGTGVDLSPYAVREARERSAHRTLRGVVDFVEADGQEYVSAAEAGRYDLAMCVGATFAFGGYRPTLAALKRVTRPGGLVLVGEPFWLKTPDPEYLNLAGHQADEFGTHAGNVDAGLEIGLRALYTLVSSPDDWDRYEALQWRASELYADRHPEDPDVPEILERQHRARAAHLRFGRDTIGWSLYLFMTPR